MKNLSRILIITLLLVGVTACTLSEQPYEQPLDVQSNATTPTETIPPYTALASLTPSQTLRPPPTFEPPTATVAASDTPSVTPTGVLNLEVSVPGLQGIASPTPDSTPGCTPRKDWKLRYTVQRDDALERIANLYNTNVSDLVAGNCLKDANVIVIGQELRVPGTTQPDQNAIPCVPWELLTPMDGTLNIEGTGNITFNWHGPRAPRNLIRVIRPNGALWERVVELRQNETVDLYKEFPDAGTYTWYVYPLDNNFVQIACHEGGPWTFTKAPSPTATPTNPPTNTPKPFPTPTP